MFLKGCGDGFVFSFASLDKLICRLSHGAGGLVLEALEWTVLGYHSWVDLLGLASPTYFRSLVIGVILVFWTLGWSTHPIQTFTEVSVLLLKQTRTHKATGSGVPKVGIVFPNQLDPVSGPMRRMKPSLSA